MTLFIFIYPCISNSLKMRPHSILKNDPGFDYADLEYQENLTVGQLP